MAEAPFIITSDSLPLPAGCCHLLLSGSGVSFHLPDCYPADWGEGTRAVSFSESLLGQFLYLHPAEQWLGIFRSSGHEVQLRPEDLRSVALAAGQAGREPEIRIAEQYLWLMLLYVAAGWRLAHGLHSVTEMTELRPLKGLLQAHFRCEWKAPFYALRIGLTTRRLNKLVKAASGKLLEELIADMLLAEAERLLRHTDMRLKEMSYELGFYNQAHFSVFFTRRKGMSPRAFRQMLHADR